MKIPRREVLEHGFVAIVAAFTFWHFGRQAMWLWDVIQTRLS